MALCRCVWFCICI